MTWNKSFKRRVRERQAQTSESYMTAMRHVRAAAGEDRAPERTEIDVVELVELSELAAALGMRCRVSMHRELLDELEPARLLAQLRSALDRPDLAMMRAGVIDGAPPATAGDYRATVGFARRDEPMVSPSGMMVQLWIGGRQRPVLVRFGLTVPPPYARATLPMRLIIGDAGMWRVR